MNLLGRFRRLSSMSPGEIAFRLRQEIAKLGDSFGFLHPRFEMPPESELPRTGKFFFGKGEIGQRLRLICEIVPRYQTTVLDQAAEILNHRFPLLGYGPVDYGEDIDWQLDAISGKRSDLIPWRRIKYLNFNEVGDSKVTWELSRHQFLVTLAKAWLLTGEERFVRKLEDLYFDWHRKNPYPLGINWASSLEVAFRSLSWIWVRELLSGFEPAARLRREIVRGLAFNAWYIRRYLSTYFAPNTHLQGEAVALFFIGTLFPALPNAAVWRDSGREILLEHALSKVLEDGAYFELSTYYHVYALDFFLHAGILARCNGAPFPDSYDDTLKRMLGFLSVLSQAGPPPRLGDDDGGRVFDGQRNRSEHLLDPLAVGTALYGLDSLRQPGVKITEEMLWLLGEEGIRSFSNCREGGNRGSASFPHAGLYVSHAGGDARSQVVFDAGPLGGGSGGHGHADALCLTLNLEEKPLLVDPGAFVYASPGPDRNNFRVTPAHNTVTVDGLSQAEPRTPFSWFRRPEVRVEAISFTPEFDFVAASHDGYERLQPPVRHRRTVFACAENFWLVLDELASSGPHDYAVHWHLAPDARVEQQSDNSWNIDLAASRLHFSTAPVGWAHTVRSGWYSPSYGRKQSAPALSFMKSARESAMLASVFAVGKCSSIAPSLSAIGDLTHAAAFRLSAGAHRSIFLFSDGISNVTIEDWECDARFLYVSLDADSRPLRVISVDCAFVRHERTILLESSGRTPYFVWQPAMSG